jgi:hypothetical protein
MTETKQKQPQAEPRTADDTTHFRILTWITSIPLLVVLYVLSVGPARVFMQEIDAPIWLWQIFRALYFPIVWLYNKSETCEKLFDTYFDWWMNIF